MPAPNIKYRIDNGGCRGAFVHAIEPNKAYFDTIDEACAACKVLHETCDWRDFPYEIVSVDISKKEWPGIPKAIRIELTIHEE